MKKISAAVMALASIACSPCEGVSGADYSRAAWKYSCEEWQAADAKAVRAFERYAPSENWRARKLLLWVVIQHDLAKWLVGETYVAGTAQCAYLQVELADAPPMKGGLAHELLHAYDGCAQVDGDAHAGWGEKGYYLAVDCVQNEACTP